MSFKVESIRKIGENLRTIARDEITRVVQLLEGLTDSNALRGAHEARKHLKKIRALLRLIRDGIGRTAFEVENDCFGDAGRHVRNLRDAQTLVRTLDTVRKRFFERHHPALISDARGLFMDDERRCLKHAAERGAMAAVLKTLRAALIRSGEWNLRDFGWKEACAALKRAYKRARAAGGKAASQRTVENLHAWRKRVKDLWYHARLLRKACPEFMDEFAHELKVLSEFLGDDHDLAMLCEALTERSRILKKPRQLAALRSMIEGRRDELINAALDLGGRLCEEPPGAFARALDKRRAKHRRSMRKKKKLASRIQS